MRFSLKRIFDITMVLFSLPVTLPLIGVIALLVRLGLGTPVFFRQVRPGLHGRPFVLVKFRTMADSISLGIFRSSWVTWAGFFVGAALTNFRPFGA